MASQRPGYIYAIAAAVLFGASTPAAKWLLNGASPWLLAGLLYLGSGLGLFLVRVIRKYWKPDRVDAAIQGSDWLWLGGATLFGGVLAPVFLMMGLLLSDSATTSLLLNLEGVFTALLAWFVFKENFDKRIMLGMGAILSGSMLLSWNGFSVGKGALGIPLVAAACLSWAIDNNLTKKIASGDALQIAMTKGLVSGIANTALAVWISHTGISSTKVVLAGVVGFLGYGVSLLCFVLALRKIGAARTGAYFSLAPFVGAAIALLFGDASFSWQLVAAVTLMGLGVWLHLSERHEHEHAHELQEHDHGHIHDIHHQHVHSAEDPPGEPHAHRHQHMRLVHTHPHFPDVHHTHAH
jgi:drug/metabolite transporter (DMT)-like permease